MNKNDDWMENFDREFEKSTKRLVKAGLVWVIFVFWFVLVILGLFIWSIIELVQWVTTK